MNDALTAVYDNIGHCIARSITSPWHVAVCVYTHDEESGTFSRCTYRTNEHSNDRQYYDIDDEAFDHFDSLHQQMNPNDQSLWRQAKFTLFHTGAFEIEFS